MFPVTSCGRQSRKREAEQGGRARAGLAARAAAFASACAGFTLIELMVTLTVFGLLLAVGVPNMTRWIVKNKAGAAGEFYADGFSTARRTAVSHNAESRISLQPNDSNGQLDWQVDLCYPSITVCSDVSGTWSTTAAGVVDKGGSNFVSIYRSASILPQSNILTPSLLPQGASVTYFTPLGWIDTTIANELNRIQFDAAPAYANDIPPLAIVVTLSGMPSTCNPSPTISAGDSRACPP